MIGIIDYGLGNLHSVQSACQALGMDSRISSKMDELEDCDRLILPGVGAFGDMAKAMCEQGIDAWLKQKVLEEHTPLLGICLGMQALYERSYEFGCHEGLGFLQGEVRLMEPVVYHEDEKRIQLPVPQIGWNELHCALDFPLYSEIKDDPYVYFDHSYLACDFNPSQLIAYAAYGPYTVPAIVGSGNVFGTQFHPEKSGAVGLRILEWFGKEFGHDSASRN